MSGCILCSILIYGGKIMSAEKAVELFTAVPKLHNCAQAVAGGCGREDLVAELASCGGGKAPGGFCGALYAACVISDEAEKEEIISRFRKAAGAITCREIKTVTGYPCVECVRTAAGLLKK